VDRWCLPNLQQMQNQDTAAACIKLKVQLVFWADCWGFTEKNSALETLKYTRIKAKNPASYNAKCTTCTAVNCPRYEAHHIIWIKFKTSLYYWNLYLILYCFRIYFSQENLFLVNNLLII
jgi:hypothetical protein